MFPYYRAFLNSISLTWNLLVWMQKYGKIDVVVSNAAVNPSVGTILDSTESTLDKLWDVNVKTAILLLQVSVVIGTKRLQEIRIAYILL